MRIEALRARGVDLTARAQEAFPRGASTLTRTLSGLAMVPDVPAPLTPDLTDGAEETEALKLASSLKRQRWALLAVALIGSAVLVTFSLGGLPGVTNSRGLAGTAGILFGAAFLATCGIGSWWLWTRIANSRTRKAWLTDNGVVVEFVNGSTTRLAWTDPNLRFVIKECSNSSAPSSGILQWGSGGIGKYAQLSREGAERVQSAALSHGLLGRTTSSGKLPNAWITTEFSHN